MVDGTAMARMAALIGDPARANMLASLMDGRAHTPSELAIDAGVSAATTSGHLTQLLEGGLVIVAVQGRHRYYRLASKEVALMLERLMTFAGLPETRRRATPRIPAGLRDARTCYDHLAGRLGVAIADRLTAKGYVDLNAEVGHITDEGQAFFTSLGVDLAQAKKSKRQACRPCLDWSERRPHIAGVLGAALLDHFLADRLIERVEGSRAIRITRRGRNEFKYRFDISTTW